MDLQGVQYPVQIDLRHRNAIQLRSVGEYYFGVDFTNNELYVRRVRDSDLEHRQGGCVVGRNETRLQDLALQAYLRSAVVIQHQGQEPGDDEAGNRQILEKARDMEFFNV